MLVDVLREFHFTAIGERDNPGGKAGLGCDVLDRLFKPCDLTHGGRNIEYLDEQSVSLLDHGLWKIGGFQDWRSSRDPDVGVELVGSAGKTPEDGGELEAFRVRIQKLGKWRKVGSEMVEESLNRGIPLRNIQIGISLPDQTDRVVPHCEVIEESIVEENYPQGEESRSENHDENDDSHGISIHDIVQDDDQSEAHP